MWLETEKESIAEGIRSSGLFAVSPDSLVKLSSWAAERGLFVTVLATQPLAEAYTAGAPAIGTPGMRVAVFNAKRVKPDEWHDSWGDDEKIGRLLGFPECCRDFFRREWSSGSIDPTWAMAQGQSEVFGPITNNVLMRWIGPRLVPHIPCSFNCKSAEAFGLNMQTVFRKLFPQTAEWAEEILSWDILWTSLHGAAEITAIHEGKMILKFAASSDYTAKKRFVRWRKA
jgi:Uncharacterized protein conserved in archaea